MYAFIMETEVESLYEGAFLEMAEVVRKRAKGLCLSLERQSPSALRDRKIAALKRIMAGEALKEAA